MASKLWDLVTYPFQHFNGAQCMEILAYSGIEVNPC